jgi:hypothetical protein
MRMRDIGALRTPETMINIDKNFKKAQLQQ